MSVEHNFVNHTCYKFLLHLSQQLLPRKSNFWSASAIIIRICCDQQWHNSILVSNIKSTQSPSCLLMAPDNMINQHTFEGFLVIYTQRHTPIEWDVGSTNIKNMHMKINIDLHFLVCIQQLFILPQAITTK